MADTIYLKDIAPAAQNIINTQFILLDKGRAMFEGQNKTCLALVADNAAAVHFQLWGDEYDGFEPSDIIRLSNGIFSYQRNNLVLRAGKRGEAEKVGEFTRAFVEIPNMSERSFGFLIRITLRRAKSFPNETYRWTDVRDVANAHIQALEIPSANGRYYMVNRSAHFSLPCT